MEYATVSARFKFFNGKEVYTVERVYGLARWYVFKDEGTSDAVYVTEPKKTVFNKVNANTAEEILYEYLKTLDKPDVGYSNSEGWDHSDMS